MIWGDVDSYLELLDVGELCHSRWLTLACRILRFYVSVSNPSESLQLLAQFCINVYFPSWFDIKKNSTVTDDSINYFNLMTRIATFPQQTVKDIELKTLLRNSFFAHPENILLSMLGDTDNSVRNMAVNRIQSLRSNSLPASYSAAKKQKQNEDEKHKFDNIWYLK